MIVAAIEHLIQNYREGNLKGYVKNFEDHMREDHGKLLEQFLSSSDDRCYHGFFEYRRPFQDTQEYQRSLNSLNSRVDEINGEFQSRMEDVDKFFARFPIDKVEQYVQMLEPLSKNYQQELQLCKNVIKPMIEFSSQKSVVSDLVAKRTYGNLYEEYQKLNKLPYGEVNAAYQCFDNLYAKVKVDYPDICTFENFVSKPTKKAIDVKHDIKQIHPSVKDDVLEKQQLDIENLKKEIDRLKMQN